MSHLRLGWVDERREKAKSEARVLHKQAFWVAKLGSSTKNRPTSALKQKLELELELESELGEIQPISWTLALKATHT